ncbi:MAG: hypothetical protein WB630_23040 [Candidatus Acidiferrales bacterium]
MEGSGSHFVQARQSLTTLQSGLLGPNVVERIFDPQDLKYLQRATAPEICNLFLAERRRISLLWVRRLRSEIRNLMHFHLSYSRLHGKLDFETELRLALDFALLLSACRALEVLLYWRGPYGAPTMVGIAAGSAARVCATSERSLAFLNPLAGDSLHGDARGGATV